MTQYESKSKGHKHNDPSLELSIGQVLAAAGATVLGAVLAKLLGLWGTLAGTAVLSVCSSIGAVLILRAMRRTGERIKKQITALAPAVKGAAPAVTVELTPENATATAKIPETERFGAYGDETVVLGTRPAGAADTDEIVIPAEPAPEGHVTKTRSNRRTLVAIIVSSVLVFTITVVSLFLLGALTGDTGRFISDAPQETVTETEAPAESGTPAETGAETPAESGTPSDPAPSSEAPSEDTSPTEAPSSEAPGETPSPDGGGTGGAEATPGPSPTPQEEALSESPATTE